MQQQWQNQNNQLYKEFIFEDFKEAFSFMEVIAREAEKMQHHPRWENEWNKVRIWLTTHEYNSTITDKDKSFAEAIDKIFNKHKHPKDDNITVPYGDYRYVKMFSDGGSRGNPGPSASGYVLLDDKDTVILKSGVYLGITTNNQAEYQSLKFGLEQAKKLGAVEVDVHMDSLLVINQMKGVFKIKNRDLWPIHESIKEIAKTFKKITYTHVPRELNKLADAEVNEVLDAEAVK